MRKRDEISNIVGATLEDAASYILSLCKPTSLSLFTKLSGQQIEQYNNKPIVAYLKSLSLNVCTEDITKYE